MMPEKNTVRPAREDELGHYLEVYFLDNLSGGTQIVPDDARFLEPDSYEIVRSNLVKMSRGEILERDSRD